jgi:transcriptional regulator with XRE-family HTH domain
MKIKIKSLQKYMEKRLTKEEIAEIEQQAKLEKKILESLQKDIARIMEDYMKRNKIGFNELVKRLDVSPTHIAKIQKGKANLTLSSLAHLCGSIGQEPHLVFRKK